MRKILRQEFRANARVTNISLSLFHQLTRRQPRVRRTIYFQLPILPFRLPSLHPSLGTVSMHRVKLLMNVSSLGRFRDMYGEVQVQMTSLSQPFPATTTRVSNYSLATSVAVFSSTPLATADTAAAISAGAVML